MAQQAKLILFFMFFAIIIAIVYLTIDSKTNTSGSQNLELDSDYVSSTEHQWQNDVLKLNSTKCIEYSPAYPSVGGPGCSPKCISDNNKRNSSYAIGYYNRTHGWPTELMQNMDLAANILKKYGPIHSLKRTKVHYVKGVGGYLHVTLDYYCCYSIEEGLKIGEFVDNNKWKPHTVRFDQMVCAIHAPGDMVSLVLMLDEHSQMKMRNYALQTEADFERMTGIKKHISNTKLQGHHMTLATVNQSVFPVKPAVDEINRTIPPGHWHSEPVVLQNPECG